MRIFNGGFPPVAARPCLQGPFAKRFCRAARDVPTTNSSSCDAKKEVSKQPFRVCLDSDVCYFANRVLLYLPMFIAKSSSETQLREQLFKRVLIPVVMAYLSNLTGMSYFFRASLLLG